MILEFDDYYDEMDRKRKKYLKEVDEALNTFLIDPIDIWQNITDIVEPFKDDFNFWFKLSCFITNTNRSFDGYCLIHQEYKKDPDFLLYSYYSDGDLLNLLKNKSERRLYFSLGFLPHPQRQVASEEGDLFGNVVKPVMERIESECDIRISNGEPFYTLAWTYKNCRSIDIEII